jgi:metal-responsive CopG/Arc/MetJ family transcriptional regulator
MTSDERVPISVVIEESLLAKVDAEAKSLDMNRSQYLRKLARDAIAREEIARASKLQPQPQEVAA